jgi:hypothetical protein
MTQDLNTIVSTMDSVFSRQDSPAGWLWHPLLRLLARGEPVTIAELAAATGRPGEEVAHAVSRCAPAPRPPGPQAVSPKVRQSPRTNPPTRRQLHRFLDRPQVRVAQAAGWLARVAR